MGIAEQDMIGFAVGLAAGGKLVFVSTFAVFLCMRCIEQIRQSICYNKFPVRLIGSHGGITVGSDGGSHQAVEDISIMRAIPGMRVLAPCDAIEMEQILNYLGEVHDDDGPVYVRMARIPYPVIYNRPEYDDYKFAFGKGHLLKDGSDGTIAACGYMVHQALEAAAILEREGYNPRVINMVSIKPIDKEILDRAARETPFILTVEEHTICGGLGSAVAETVSEKHPVLVSRMGLDNEFGISGSTTAELLARFRLDAEAISDAFKKLT